ncbi:MAG: DUF4179 domain-containing protein [Clostridia bacterium]|nr:DUF4179 domain-containing protein [Clostridia bacterium]
MNHFDKRLNDICKANIELPEWYQYTVRNTLREENKKTLKIGYRKISKLLVASVSCLVLATTIVFANYKEISNNIKNFFKENKGMDTAIENGYISKSDMNYIDSNNVAVKIEDYLMDDFNLCFSLSIKFDESIDIASIEKIDFPDFLILDENKKVLYCNNKVILNEYINEENLNYQDYQNSDNFIGSGINTYVKDKDIEENSIKVIFNLFSNSFPKSRYLKFRFKTIEIKSAEQYSISGNWNLEMDIPEKFYNREAIVYKVRSCSDNRITVQEAAVYDTCMKLRFAMTLYGDGVSKEEVLEERKKHNEELNEIIDRISSDGVYTAEESQELLDFTTIFSDDDYVETSSGKTFGPNRGGPDESGYSDGTNTGIIEFHQTYSLTKSDTTNYLKVHLKYLENGNWKDIVIELER